MANHMRTKVSLNALAMAVAAQAGLVHGVIFHSDHGSQYMSDEFVDRLAALGMV